MVTAKILALCTFSLIYILFIIFPHKRTYAAVAGVVILLATMSLSFKQAFFAINWNVMGIFVGTLLVAEHFIESRVPAFLAEIIVNKSKNTKWAILFICALTGFISAFVENVATVLIVAPIALALAEKMKLNPVKMMIGIAISSNLQGAATLIGDPPSMLLAGYAKMNFLDFFVYNGKLSIFFAVEIGALFSFIILYIIYREFKSEVSVMKVEKVQSWFPTILLTVLIILLAFSSFFDTEFSYLAGTLCMIAGAISILWEKFVNRISLRKRLKHLDWDTTIFLLCIFILVGSMTINGWIDTISQTLAGIIGNDIMLAFIILVASSVLFSAFVDNVPFLAAMLPVCINLAQSLNIEPALMLFGLLIGASLGGNITPIGASANIVACGLLKKHGYTIKFMEFVKIGFPFTITAVTVGAFFVWLIWK